MGKRLHAPRTAPKSVSEATPLSAELLRHVATDITRAKATLEPSVFSAALHLIQNPSTPVAPLPSRASARHWQGITEASARQHERTQLETLTATRASSTRATPAPPSFQHATQAQRGAAPSQHWHAQIQRYGIESYAKHYADQTDFQTRSADLTSSGEALHPVLLEALEIHFQQRLPAIQIHSDSSAASRAKAVDALAFTSGSGIHFGAGQYQPFTPEGFKLLVHETAHVLQQASGIVPEGIDTDPSLERAAQLEASRVTNVPSLNDAPKPLVSSQLVQNQSVSSQRAAPQFETPGQWAAHLLNTLKHHSVPRERFAVVAELYTQIPADQQGKAKALMLGKLNPNSSEHGRLEASLMVTPSVATKSSGSSRGGATPRVAGELNFFTYFNPTERNIVLPQYKAFPVSSEAVKVSPMLETAVAPSSRSVAPPSRSVARVTNIQRSLAPGFTLQRDPAEPVAPAAQPAVKGTTLNLRGAAFSAKYPVKLRSDMNASSKTNIVAEIPFGTTFLITESISSWYKIKLDSGQTGFVAGENISVAPDAKATFYKIKAGDNAIDIAKKHYNAKLGLDLRFYVGVLAKLNPKSIKMPSNQVSWGDDSSVTAWKNANPMVGFFIWIPSPAYASSLKGSVNNGKLSDHPLEAAAEVGKGIVKKTIEQLPGGKGVLETLNGIGSNASKIFDNPEAFVSNLVKSFKNGFTAFGAGFGNHLGSSFVDVLTGNLGGQVNLAQVFQGGEFKPQGALNMGLELLGITPASLINRIPGGAAAVQGSQAATSIFKDAQDHGVGFVLQRHLSGINVDSLKDSLLAQVKSWAQTVLVKKALEVIASSLIPGVGIVQAAIKIYETIMYVWERFKQIAKTVQNFSTALAKIASGDIKGATGAIVTGLISGLSVAVGFFFKVSGLGGIADRVKLFFKGIQAKIEVGIQKFIAFVKSKLPTRGETKPQAPTTTKPKDPDHDKKVAAGLAQIDAEEAKIDAKDNDSKLTKAQATQVAATVKSNNPIFTKIIVHYEVAKNEINYEWFASNGIRKSNRKPYTDDLEPAADEGTRANPFPLDWAKPASATYPKIFLGGTRTDYKSQNDLSQMVGKMDESGVIVKQYAPHTRAVLPGGETIGLTANHYLDVGTVIGPLAADGVKSAGGYLINDVLRKYGFRPDKDRLDGDHVHEMQLGGQNVLENLWPLDKSTNRGSGSTIDKADVRLRDGRVIKVYQLRQFVKTSGRNIYFSIRSVA